MSAAGRFDDDAGDGDARRREDVDAGETRREVGRCRVVVVVGVVSRTNRIESSTHSFIHSRRSFIHRLANGTARGTVIETREAGTTSRHAAE